MRGLRCYGQVLIFVSTFEEVKNLYVLLKELLATFDFEDVSSSG